MPVRFSPIIVGLSRFSVPAFGRTVSVGFPFQPLAGRSRSDFRSSLWQDGLGTIVWLVLNQEAREERRQIYNFL